MDVDLATSNLTDVHVDCCAKSIRFFYYCPPILLLGTDILRFISPNISVRIERRREKKVNEDS